MPDESVTILAACRKSVAIRRKILEVLHWMRYLHGEESTPSSATHFLPFIFLVVTQAATI